MTSDMSFECLLVSSDPCVFRTLAPLLEDFAIKTNVYPSASNLAFSARESTADLLVVDVDAHNSIDAIREIRQAPHRQKPTILAVLNSAGDVAGADMLLRKPITRQAGIESLKAAYWRMVRDFRKHTRFAVMNRVLATDENGTPISVMVTNIGEGGVGLSSARKLPIGSLLSFDTTLPGLANKIHIRSRILWTRDYGVAGAEFVKMPSFDIHLLHAWLHSRYRIKKPLIQMEELS
jgi:CheY-like chemotaxis protein